MEKPFMSLLLLYALACALPFCAAQTQQEAKRIGPQADSQATAHIWLERANQWTNELLTQDRPVLDPELLPLLDMHLSQIWWKSDPMRAHQWLNAAAEAVERIRQDEKEESRETRIRNGSDLVQAAMELRESAVAYRVAAVVEKEITAEKDPITRQRSTAAFSRALVNGQMRSESHDPQEVLAIGRELVKIGNSYALGQIEMKLRSTDPAAADQLIAEALQEAVSARDPMMLYFALGASGPIPPG